MRTTAVNAFDNGAYVVFVAMLASSLLPMWITHGLPMAESVQVSGATMGLALFMVIVIVGVSWIVGRYLYQKYCLADSYYRSTRTGQLEPTLNSDQDD